MARIQGNGCAFHHTADHGFFEKESPRAADRNLLPVLAGQWSMNGAWHDLKERNTKKYEFLHGSLFDHPPRRIHRLCQPTRRRRGRDGAGMVFPTIFRYFAERKPGKR